MKKRTKKLLSLLLAAAMVFTTNTIAFAEEVTVDAVDETVEAEEVVVTLDADEDAVIDADATEPVTLSSNVMSWYVGDKDANGELMARYFFGYSNGEEAIEKKSFESEHFTKDGKVTISDNRERYARDPHYNSSHCTNTGSYGYTDAKEKKIIYPNPINATFDTGVSTNVLQLDDKTFLLVAYKLEGSIGKQIGTNTPVVPFNGMKYDAATNDPHNGKIKKNNYDIYVDAALVTQEAGNAPVLITNTLSSNLKGKKYVPTMTVKITPKNNINANVSRNALYDEKGNYLGFPAIKNPWYKKDTDHPYFTISVSIKADKNNKALTDAVKVFNKNKNKAKNQQGVEGLNKTEFKFDICQNSFANFAYTNAEGKETISAADIQPAASAVQNHYDDTKYDSTNEELGFRHIYPYVNFEDADNYLFTDPLGNLDTNKYASKTQWIGKRTLITDGGKNIGTIDLFTDAKKAGKNNIPVYLVNATGEYDQVMNNAGWNLKKKFATYKLKKGKDYKVEELKLDDKNTAIVLKPTGNFDEFSDGVIFRNAEYTIPANTYEINETTKDKKVTELRVGIYNTSHDNYYVDSAE